MLRPKSKADRIAMRFIPKDYTMYKECENGIVYASPNKLHAISFMGTSSKSHWYYQFMCVEKMERAAEIFIEKCAAVKEWQESKKKDKAEFKTDIKVGDILHTSWGYEQTNVEFFQVLNVKGNTITIQEICADYESTGYMAGRVVAIPNKPAKENHWEGDICTLVDAPILKKRVSVGNSVKINDSASAWIWDGKPCYTSSYA
jgi:hypothetical protein